jgi:hypothetical protein
MTFFKLLPWESSFTDPLPLHLLFNWGAARQFHKRIFSQPPFKDNLVASTWLLELGISILTATTIRVNVHVRKTS